jgi:hypothetical protein
MGGIIRIVDSEELFLEVFAEGTTAVVVYLMYAVRVGIYLVACTHGVLAGFCGALVEERGCEEVALNI